MKAQLLTLKAIGLRTYENQFSAPPGAMSAASNIIIDRPDVIESVRQFNSSVPASPGPVYGLTLVDSQLILASSFTFIIYVYPKTLPGAWSIINGRYYQNGGSGPLSGPSLLNAVDGRLDCFLQNGSTYITTDSAVYKLEPGTTSVRRYGAGMPQPNPMLFDDSSGGRTSPLAAGDAVRYRALYARKDNQKYLVAGPPSSDFIFFNDTGSDITYKIEVFLPERGIEPGDIIQIYRSETTHSENGIIVTPSDELQQVIEYVVLQSDITTGHIFFNDTTPDGARGGFLYTNANTGEGILQANARPPLSACATSFKSVAWYANTTPTPSQLFTLLDVSSWSSAHLLISNGTTTYDYAVGGSPTNDDINSIVYNFALNMNLLPSIGNPDVQVTIPGGTIRYESAAVANADGVFNIATLGNGTDSNGTWTFSITGGDGTSFSPSLPATLTSDVGPNRLYFSKPGQPEAVPILNYVEVGQRSDPILALQPLRDSLFVFKARDGLFRVTGQTATDIQVECFDPTILITQSNSVSSAGNKLYCCCTQGVAEITEYGARIVSSMVENTLLPLVANPNLTTVFTGRACQTEKKYVFVANGTTCYMYNYDRELWTTRSVNGNCRALTAGALGTTLSISDRFFFGDTGSAVWDMIPPAASNPNLFSGTPSWTYVIVDGDNPGMKKRFHDVSCVITGSAIQGLIFSFSTETTHTPESVTVDNLDSQSMVARCLVPRSCQYASQLTLTITAQFASQYLKVSGVSVTYYPATTRTTR